MKFVLAILALSVLAGCTSYQMGTSPSRDATVYYATNRAASSAGSLAKKFGPDRAADEQVQYGEIEVGLLPTRAVGAPKGATITALREIPDRRSFDSRVVASLEIAKPKIVFIYVHGYNTTFGDAAVRAGQLAADIRLTDRPFAVCYSWPSRGSVKGYVADEEAVEATQPALTEVLLNVKRCSGDSKVVLLGHSMGCRALTSALKYIVFQKGIDNAASLVRLFDQVIFLEPDIDREIFKRDLVLVKPLCKHITVYASSRDHVLGLSQYLHFYARLGNSPQFDRGIHGIDTIDMSGARSQYFGHDYDSPKLMADLHKLITEGTPAESREGIAKITEGVPEPIKAEAAASAQNANAAIHPKISKRAIGEITPPTSFKLL